MCKHTLFENMSNTPEWIKKLDYEFNHPKACYSMFIFSKWLIRDYIEKNKQKYFCEKLANVLSDSWKNKEIDWDKIKEIK